MRLMVLRDSEYPLTTTIQGKKRKHGKFCVVFLEKEHGPPATPRCYQVLIATRTKSPIGDSRSGMLGLNGGHHRRVVRKSRRLFPLN